MGPGEPAAAVDERRTEGPSVPDAVLPVIPLDLAAADPIPKGQSPALRLPVALTTIVLTYWCIDIVSPALPAIQDDLKLSAAGAGLVFSLLFAGRLVGNLPAAFLVARFGASVTAAAGGALLTGGSLMASLSTDGLTLFPARIVQGAGISLLVTAALRSILRAKPGQGAAMTLFSFMATIGGVFGLESGGVLTEAIGWRAVFALCVGLAAVVAVGTFLARSGTVPKPIPARSQAEPIPSAAPAPGSVASIVPALLFNFLVFVNYSVFVILPLYATHRFDASAATTANLLLVITVVHLVAAFPVGRAIRRWGASPALAVGLGISTVGMGTTLLAPGTIWLVVPMILYGLGQVAASNAGGDIVLQGGGRDGRAVGLVRLSSDLGLVLGPYAAGVLSDALGYGAPFVALPALTAGAAVIAWRHPAAPARRVLL